MNDTTTTNWSLSRAILLMVSLLRSGRSRSHPAGIPFHSYAIEYLFEPSELMDPVLVDPSPTRGQSEETRMVIVEPAPIPKTKSPIGDHKIHDRGQGV